MFSTRTRLVGGIFCALLLMGVLRPVVRPMFSWVVAVEASGDHATRVITPQYLPWATGRTVRVNQGNGGLSSHDRVQTRHGWDFGLAHGDPVLAGVTGEAVRVSGGCAVVSSPDCHDGWGNSVIVRVTDGTCARFGHLATIAVTRGQKILVGMPIGTVGSSGRSTDFHLHYQREVCATGQTLPSQFVEAGVPQAGTFVTSRLPVA